MNKDATPPTPTSIPLTRALESWCHARNSKLSILAPVPFPTLEIPIVFGFLYLTEVIDIVLSVSLLGLILLLSSIKN